MNFLLEIASVIVVGVFLGWMFGIFLYISLRLISSLSEGLFKISLSIAKKIVIGAIVLSTCFIALIIFSFSSGERFDLDLLVSVFGGISFYFSGRLALKRIANRAQPRN